jgi:hypothetical protein
MYEAKGGREYNRRYDSRNFGSYQNEREDTRSPESTAHGGGIIKLPANTDTSDTTSQSSKQHVEFHNMGHRGERSRYNPRDSHSHGNPGQRMLFDPKNPDKMIMVPSASSPSGTPTSQLKFRDPSGQESPQSPPTQQHPLMPPPGGFPPPIPPHIRGYPPFYAGYDPRYQDPVYGGPSMPGPPMPGFYYGYPPMYRDPAMYREEDTELSG